MPTEGNAVHSFTLKGTGLLNVIHTPIEVSTYYDHGKKFSTRGIWDTGASGTVITQEVISALNLQPTGVTFVNTASEQKVKTTTYDIMLHFSANLTVHIQRATLGVITTGIGCLIGMDVIMMGDFSITNFQHKTCMTFRIPSLHEIDYQKNPRLKVPYISNTSIGRNDNCPCGSGEKYKHCHGK